VDGAGSVSLGVGVTVGSGVGVTSGAGVVDGLGAGVAGELGLVPLGRRDVVGLGTVLVPLPGPAGAVVFSGSATVIHGLSWGGPTPGHWTTSDGGAVTPGVGSPLGRIVRAEARPPTYAVTRSRR
jgi:hypothetical protein